MAVKFRAPPTRLTFRVTDASSFRFKRSRPAREVVRRCRDSMTRNRLSEKRLFHSDGGQRRLARAGSSGRKRAIVTARRCQPIRGLCGARAVCQRLEKAREIRNYQAKELKLRSTERKVTSEGHISHWPLLIPSLFKV